MEASSYREYGNTLLALDSSQEVGLDRPGEMEYLCRPWQVGTFLAGQGPSHHERGGVERTRVKLSQKVMLNKKSKLMLPPPIDTKDSVERLEIDKYIATEHLEWLKNDLIGIALTAADPFYKHCARADEFECSGRVTWEHALIYASKQMNEPFAIIPLCAYHHAVDKYQDGGDLNKLKNSWIAISRMTDEDKARYPRFDWNARLYYLEKVFGSYSPPLFAEEMGINYPELVALYE